MIDSGTQSDGRKMLRGTVEIYGMNLSATVDISGLMPVAVGKVALYRNGKYRVYKMVRGIQVHLGYYTDRALADQAAMLGKDLSVKKPRDDKQGIYLTARNGTSVYRVVLKLKSGQVARLGEYQTWGNALLARDVVARRTGSPVTVVDYEMPLSLLSNAVARSYITDRIEPPTPEQIAEYQRRVAELNATRPDLYDPTRTHTVTPPTIPDELVPSQLRRSPYDTLDDEE